MAQVKYKVIWDGRSSLVKQRFFPLKIWLSWKWILSFTGMFFSVLPGNEALDFGCGVPVWRQQFVPVVIRTDYSDSHSYTKDENCLNLLFVVVQSSALNAEGFPVLQKRGTGNSSQCPAGFWYLFQLLLSSRLKRVQDAEVTTFCVGNSKADNKLWQNIFLQALKTDEVVSVWVCFFF